MKVLILLALAAVAVASPQYAESNVAAQGELHRIAKPFTRYDEQGTPYVAYAPAHVPIVAAAPAPVPIVAAAPAPVFAPALAPVLPAPVPVVAARAPIVATVPTGPVIADTADGRVAYQTHAHIAY